MLEKICPSCGLRAPREARFCSGCGAPLESVGTGEAKKVGWERLEGRVLDGKYRILSLVGEGGMGAVYRAEQVRLGRIVAVKVLHRELTNDTRAVARFRREARAASLLNHPNSIAVLDFGQAPEGFFYLVTEFLQGKPLSAFLAAQGGRLEPWDAYSIVRQVLGALAHAHDLGIVHRDLKPENIFVRRLSDGSIFAKVLDFGVAKELDPEVPALTSPGMVCGTPEFMAPEQAMGRPVDNRTDLYAVGVVLYELLTGVNPFERGSAAETMVAQVREGAPPLSVYRSDLPGREELEVILDKALAKDPEKRIPNAREFVRLLDGWAVRAFGLPAGEAGQEILLESLDPSSPVATVPGASTGKGRATGGLQGETGRLLELVASTSSSRRRLVTLGQILRERESRPGHRVEVRARELESALAALAKGVVVVSGADGMGKTWLLSRIRDSLRQEGRVAVLVRPDGVLRRCSVLEPVRAALGQILDMMPDLLDRLDAPSKQTLLAAMALHPRPWSPEVARQNLLVAWRAVLRQLPPSVVFLFDDGERYDSATRFLLAEWARWSDAASHAYCLATSDVSFVRDLPRVALGPLAPESLSRLLETLGAGGALPEHLLAAMEGLPFYAVHTAAAAVEGSLPADSVAGGQDVLDSRWRRMDEQQQRCLQALAVVDEPVDAARLQQILESDLDAPSSTTEADLDRTLELLADVGWVVRVGTDAYELAHGLLGKCVLSALPAGVEERLRRTLLRSGPPPVEPEGVLRRAAHVLAVTEKTESDLSALEFSGCVRVAFGDTQGAIREFVHLHGHSLALWLGGGVGDAGLAAELARIGVLLAYVLRLEGDQEGAEAVLREALHRFAGLNPAPWTLAWLRHDLAVTELHAGRVEAAAQLLADALECVAGRHWYLDAKVSATIGELAARRGSFHAAVDRLDDAMVAASQVRGAGNPYSWRIPLLLAELYLAWEGPGQSQDFARQALVAAEDGGDDTALARVHETMGRIALAARDKSGALAAWATAVEHWRRVPDRRGEAVGLMGLLESELLPPVDAGAAGRIRETLDQAAALVETMAEGELKVRLERLRRSATRTVSEEEEG